MIKNLPASAGDTSSIPGLGRLDMPQGNKAPTSQLLSPRSRARELQLRGPGGLQVLKPTHLELELSTQRSHRSEMPKCNPHLMATRESPCTATKI